MLPVPTFSAFLTSMIFLSAAHFLGDYAFQSAWMAAKKVPKNYDPAQDPAGPWEVLTYHCLTYTATFLLFLELRGHPYSLWALATIFVVHMIEDSLKARGILIKKIWQDQVIHLGTLIPIVLLGWV